MSATTDDADKAARSLGARVHAALMPDYNPKATAYWWTMVTLGALVLGTALAKIAALPAAAIVQVVAACVVAILAGMFPVRIPGSKNAFAAGEIFIFLLLLIHGPAAAVVAAAGEAFVGSARSSKRWTSRLASPAMATVAMALIGGAQHLLLGTLRGAGMLSEPVLLLSTMSFAVAYFALNTLLITLVLNLKRNERPTISALLGNFGWVGITYAASSLIAGLLFLTFQTVGWGVLLAAAPIIAMLLTTMHFHFKQRETDHAAQLVRVEAAEREAAQSARHLAEMQRSEQRFHSAFSHAAIGMALVSTDARVLQVNNALCELLGRSEAEVLGREFGEFVMDEGLLGRLLPGDAEAPADAVELRCRHPRGEEVWVSMHAGAFSEPHSSAPCFILQAQDITARRRAESRLHHIAYHDSLTALVNRARFGECLAGAIARYKAERRNFALMYLDFDRFKLINDTLGHSAGDQFLVTVSRRIQALVRPADTVARLGGDEFAILVEDLQDEAFAVGLAERLQEALKKPYEVEGTEVNSSASIGITFGSVGYDTPDEVLRDADIAMYRAKAAGRGRSALFNASLRAQIADQVQLEADLRVAIDEDKLTLAYQPIYDLDSGRIESFEALARWQHSERGAIGPDRFIPIAEESGLIGALTERILTRACRQLKMWHLEAGQAQLGMQVNLSGLNLAQEALALQVATTLLANGLAASHLTLELTESTLMTRLDTATDAMTRLRDIGAGLSVDDFGTGYSSLSYLSTLPITSLKIDRSFVSRLSNGRRDAEVVKAIITLGNALGKTVVAEGIETAEQLATLRALGCRYGQGYLLARPMPADVARQMLAQGPASAPVLLVSPPAVDSRSMVLH